MTASKNNFSLPGALTIAGSDSGGGAGIQADLLTFAANDTFGATAITCLTAQNPESVSGVIPIAPAFVLEQCRQVARFFNIGAIKTGMLFNAEIIGAVAEFLDENPEIPYVLDPVMVASSGAILLEKNAIAALREKLVPRAMLVTPNLDEGAILLGGEIHDTEIAALSLAKKFDTAVLLKGGHGGMEIIKDVLGFPNGDKAIFSARRINDTDTHGSGCTLSAAIAANLAKGENLRDAVKNAHAYLQNAIREPVPLTTKSEKQNIKSYIAHLRKIKQ